MLASDKLHNLERLADVYIEICKLFKNPPPINSGFRTLEEQSNLYNRMGKKPKLGSAHCQGAAMDLGDADGAVFATLSKPENLMRFGIYLEAKSATPTWCHVQITPPRSGKRVFIP